MTSYLRFCDYALQYTATLGIFGEGFSLYQSWINKKILSVMGDCTCVIESQKIERLNINDHVGFLDI